MRKRTVPYLYEKILKEIGKKEVTLSEFKNILVRIRIPKSDFKKITMDMVQMGLIELDGKYHKRKIKIL